MMFRPHPPSRLGYSSSGSRRRAAAAAGILASILCFGPPGRPDAVAARSQSPAEVCRVTVDKTAAPTHLELGQQVEVTLTIAADCPGGGPTAGPVDVVLAIDRSSSQKDNGTWQPTLDAAAIFLDLLDYPRTQVGIVAFEAQASLVQPLTADAARLKLALGAIPDPPALGLWTSITAGIEAAQAELVGPRHRPEAKPILVLLSDGEHNAPLGGSPLAAASQAKLAGSTILSIGLAPNSRGTNTLKAIASKPEYYFPAPTAADLAAAWRDAAGALAGGVGKLTELVVTDILPPEVRYVDGSAAPSAAFADGTLTWTIAELASGARWEARYRLLPLVAGRYVTNKLAYVDYKDADGNFANRLFPEPLITVRNTGEKIKAFLPLLQRGYCRPGDPFDVVLALDSSTSMDAPKFAAMQAAAREFLSYLDLPPSQAALVAFHGQAQRVQDLSADRAALLAALDALPRGEGTRIDRALETAVAVLSAPGRLPANKGVIVLITDGKQEETGEQPVLNAAAAARRAGELYVIGLGADVDQRFLTRVAGNPSRYFQAPASADLVRIYAQIAGALPCGQ